jgi:hypothetical protein
MITGWKTNRRGRIFDGLLSWLDWAVVMLFGFIAYVFKAGLSYQRFAQHDAQGMAVKQY